ncbi:MAG: site-2 protease family protein [Acidobacteriota bacterium]
MPQNPGIIIIWFVVFLLSLTVHECAHAWAAERSGDPTGRYLGRITLNPIPHIDILGTIVLPLVMMIYAGWMFGWAKPVPFNSLNLRDRKMGEILIALAGPLSNVLLATGFFTVAKVLLSNESASASTLGGFADPVGATLSIGLQTNIVLAIFNLIPIPPLDGHHILRNLLPDSLGEKFAEASPWLGLIGMAFLLSTGFAGQLINPVMQTVFSWLR